MTAVSEAVLGEVADTIEFARYRHRPGDDALKEVVARLPPFASHELACRALVSRLVYDPTLSPVELSLCRSGVRLKREWMRGKKARGVVEACDRVLDASDAVAPDMLLTRTTLLIGAAACSLHALQACGVGLWASSWHHAIYAAARYGGGILERPTHGHSLGKVRKVLRTPKMLEDSSRYPCQFDGVEHPRLQEAVRRLAMNFDEAVRDCEGY